MPDQKYPQFSRNGLRSQFNGKLSAHPQGGVVQEKVALTSDPKASGQAASVPHGQRPRGTKSKNARVQSSHARQRNKVPFTLHVDPILKAAVKRQAETDKVSASQCGSALLEAMVRQTIHTQQAATLESALEAIIDRKLRQRDDRLASLLIHNLLSSERTLHIVTQLLNLTPGLTPEVVAQILDKAAKDARRKIANRNPQLEDIIKELKEILAANEDEETSEPPK